MPIWLEASIRSASILIGLFIITRMLGKKQLSKLSFFEYIVGITVGDIAAAMSVDLSINLREGIPSILIWSLVPVAVSYISLKNKKFRDFVEGNSTVFIKNGKVLEDNLKKEKYTIDELMEQLRKKDVFRLADVEFAVLEPNGDLNVLLKREKQPLAVGDVFPNAPNEKEPQTVIMDGKILDEPLSTAGLNRRWLQMELEKQGVTLENVFIAQVDSYGQLTVDLYDDKIQIPEASEKQLLLAALKKVEADFEIFALETKAEEAKAMYQKNAEKIRNLLAKVEPLLKN
ncbi:hypothetical protein AT864_01774 [Anoxybacillus sp. P3H1B]|uniref:DUF421 domain-containing protein n=1 Tax=Anoxybacteroides rupiense TaxID=311460 RepID=A0ABD5IVD4_9BACL|nr:MULTISPECIES: DUF421 domain-containing protein [Anoxybacillus]KXG10213.1 hypothetical protein AT864_01774 [Anoxybacillus sp. P3H1B]MBB3907440.1 uncharacterized membrane protein YcaP (DUF421 family) [Anoxybacillus rupiensis]MBS2770443.1 DUF421 domain-containing protein [Anoxybacillus rupiensis]MED5051911.1 DUF421 domain-containing protein [Anoxybacillus rupiensis]OQM46650.1 hypothetical protein B6A27_05695 [Anoxybacillus sp. UARK-01]